MKKIILAGLAFCAISTARELIIIDENGQRTSAPMNVFVDNTKLLQSELEKCQKGDARACSEAGMLYENGENGIKQDLSKAAELYTKACNGGNGGGCLGMGSFNYAGVQGVIKKDDKKAEEFFIKACDLGEPMGCGAAGNMSKDKKTARAFFKKACDLGDQGGCQAYNNSK